MESSVHYSFKGHGIVGGALIEMYVSPQLIENFTPYGLTKDDFGDISLCCDSHMCGYFANCGKEYDCRFHHACFRMMPPSAKRVLCTLRVGDQVFIFRHVVFIHTLIQGADQTSFTPFSDISINSELNLSPSYFESPHLNGNTHLRQITIHMFFMSFIRTFIPLFFTIHL